MKDLDQRKIVIFLLIAGITIWCVFAILDVRKNHGNKYTVCGQIVGKGDKLVGEGKYDVTTDYLFAVDFPHGSEDIEVTLGTWSSHKVGDRICFDRKTSASFSSIALLLIVGIVAFAIVFVRSIFWILGISNE